ncbi:MAG TPA: inositol monophosphatase family protein, partial [Candidatus Thermoplasmatota archaeon]|nr:inositol monophosphatase family protein [Candidatus Thermoplasmatota archaeon]
MTFSDKERADIERLFADMADAVTRRTLSLAPERWGETTGMGADGTPTKLVDQVAEDEARAVLDQSGFDFSLVSEECGAIERGGDWWIVLDPVDGTTNAARGIPYYCTTLALGRRSTDDVVYGLTRNIPTGETFSAWRGAGVRRNGHPVRAAPFPREERPTFALVLGKRANATALKLAGMRANVRALGAAALDLALVASGALELYYHGYGSLRVTDIAAGVLFVREAGGVVLDGEGKPLAMPLTLAPRSTVLAVGDPSALAPEGPLASLGVPG